MFNRNTVLLILMASASAGILAACAAKLNPQRSTQATPLLVLKPYHPDGIYKVRETVGWTVSPGEAAAPLKSCTYAIKKNNLEVVKFGELDLTSGTAKIETELDEPGMLYLRVDPVTDSGGAQPDPQPARRSRGFVAGAAVAPMMLKPSVERPSDFDAFWASKIKLLQQIQLNPVLTPKESGTPGVEYSIIQMDHVNGAHVYGQFAKPNKEGKFPALLLLQWASPPYPLQRSWVTGHAADGWLTLDIEPHNVLPDQPQAYYDALPQALKNYASIGQDDRDESYFLQMYLADYRAVEYLASRPDWDGKTLVVMGTSMGGQQSLCVAGLNRRITHVIVDEPSGCDLNAALHGRQSGYPSFPPNDSKAMETARYFDAVNFASRIRARSLVAMGFLDTIAPPAGIWTAFNQIKSFKKAAPMVDSPHNNTATPMQQLPYTDRAAEWLKAIQSGASVERLK